MSAAATRDQSVAAARAMARASAARGVKGFMHLYDDDILVWHGNDRVSQSKADV